MPLPLGPSVFPDGDPTPLLTLLQVLMLRTSMEKQAKRESHHAQSMKVSLRNNTTPRDMKTLLAAEEATLREEGRERAAGNEDPGARRDEPGRLKTPPRHDGATTTLSFQGGGVIRHTTGPAKQYTPSILGSYCVLLLLVVLA